MSDTSGGPGWWMASDGKWYPPQAQSGVPAPTPGGPGGPYGQPYGQPGYGGPGVPRTDPMGIVALCVALLSIPLTCLCGIGILGLATAVPLGFVSRKRIRESPGQLKGEGVALAGAIIGLVFIALYIAFWIFYGAAFFSVDRRIG